MHGIGHELEGTPQIHAVVIRSLLQMTHVISLSLAVRDRVLGLLTVPAISDFPANHGVFYHWEQRNQRVAGRGPKRSSTAPSKAVCWSIKPHGLVPFPMPEDGSYRLNILSRGVDGEPHFQVVPKYMMPSHA